MSVPEHHVAKVQPTAGVPPESRHGATLVPREGGTLPASKAIRCCILSFSRIADDPRVRRQGDALHALGWSVTAVGLPSVRSPRPAWELRTVEPPPPSGAFSKRFVRLGKIALAGRIETMLPPLFRSINGYWDLYEAARDIAADIYIANDWNMLPIAAALSERHGGIFVYDSHELATAEHEESFFWRFFYGRLAYAVERRYIRRAALVLTVSDSIARTLRQAYQLSTSPTVVRNVPAFQDMPFNPTNPRRITVLFQGVISKDRGIEILIQSVPLWRSEFLLVIRGPSDPAYRERLGRLISQLGMVERVRLEDPCRPADLIKAANAADVGIHPLDGINRNNQFALPNKIFEYMMAGLAICVSDLPEMAAVVHRYQCGTVIKSGSPQGIAAVVNQLSASDIDLHKSKSLKAVQEVCWKSERKKLVDAFQDIAPALRSSLEPRAGCGEQAIQDHGAIRFQ